MELKIAATEPQYRYYCCQAKYPAFVAGFGAGKSEALGVQAIRDATLGGAGSLIGVYTPTFELIKMISLPRIQDKLDELGVTSKYHGGDNVLYTSRTGLGDFVMRSMMNPNRIVGYETFRSHIDELDTLPLQTAENVWNKVIARNRQIPKGMRMIGRQPEHQNRVSVYTTPEGFRFVYQKWDRSDNPDYEIIRASTYSNPNLPEDYIEALRNTYPEQLIEAYIEGHFVNLTSGAVYRHFDRDLNNCDTEVFRETNEKPGEPIHVGMDFNYLVGCSGIFVLRGDEAHAVDEIWKAFDTDDQIAVIKERYRGHQIHVYPDATGVRLYSSNTAESDIMKLKNAGFRVHHNPANPSVRDRVNAVNGMICSADGTRLLKVNKRNCPHMVDGFEQQVFDDNGMPDKTQGHDHLMDGSGYFLNYHFGVKRGIKIRKLRGL